MCLGLCLGFFIPWNVNDGRTSSEIVSDCDYHFFSYGKCQVIQNCFFDFFIFFFWTGIKKWLFLISCWNTVCIITVCLVVMSNSQSLVSFTIISKCLSYGFQISNDLIFICLCKIQWKRIPLSFYSKIFVKITFMLIITCLARTKEN